jgi:hypothetical protein
MKTFKQFMIETFQDYSKVSFIHPHTGKEHTGLGDKYHHELSISLGFKNLTRAIESGLIRHWEQNNKAGKVIGYESTQKTPDSLNTIKNHIDQNHKNAKSISIDVGKNYKHVFDQPGKPSPYHQAMAHLNSLKEEFILEIYSEGKPSFIHASGKESNFGLLTHTSIAQKLGFRGIGHAISSGLIRHYELPLKTGKEVGYDFDSWHHKNLIPTIKNHIETKHKDATQIAIDTGEGSSSRYFQSKPDEPSAYHQAIAHLNSLNERFLTKAETLKAYYKGINEGTIGKCPKCGSPNLGGLIPPDFESRKCDDCGKVSDKWKINK